MSALGDIFKKEGVSEAQLSEIVGALKVDPMAAMAQVKALNLSEEANGKIIAVVMTQPDAIDELATELGLSQEDIDIVKKTMQNPPDISE